MIEDILTGKWDKVRENLGKGIMISLISYTQRKLNEGYRQAIKEIRKSGKRKSEVKRFGTQDYR